MSRVGCCVTVYLLLLAHVPAAFCLELPQQELGGHHLNPERNFGGLPREFNEFEPREGFQHPERFQHPQGFENRDRLNKPVFGIQHGLENPEQLHNFEQQHNRQINGPRFGQLDFQQGHNEQDILHRIELNELDKSKNIPNYQLEHGEKGLLPGLEPRLQRFERFKHKEKGLLQPNESNGLKNSQGNFEFGQQERGLLEGIKSKRSQSDFRQQRNVEGLRQSDELKGLKKSQGLRNFEREEHLSGLSQGLKPKINRNELNGLKNSQGLGNFEFGQKERGLLEGLKPKRSQSDFRQQRNAEGLLQSDESNGLKKSQGLLNFEREEQSRGLLQGLEPQINRKFDLGLGNIQGPQNFEFRQQENDFLQRPQNLHGFEQLGLGQKSKQLQQSIELNGLKKSQGVRNSETGQQQGGLLQDIQSEERQQFKINNLRNRGNKELLQNNQINAFNNAQGLRNLEIIEQQNALLEKLEATRLKQTQNLNLQQGYESQGLLQGNEFDIIKNAQKERKIQLGQQQDKISEGIRFNGERRFQDKELQKEKQEQQLISQNFNGQLNQQVFTPPLQINQQNLQEINRFTQPAGFPQTYPYNRPTFPQHFNFNENRPDKATVQRMIEEAHILAQNLRRIHQNLKNPLPTAPLPGSPLKLAHPNISPNNAESFSINVQPVSQFNGQSVVKLNQINSQSLRAELENADKILLDDLARRGFRINEVTHKLERIPGAAQVHPLPIIQTAPIRQPEVLRAISSAEGALEKTVSQVSASAQATANADSSSQFNLPPAIPTILNTADLSSTHDRSDRGSINVGIKQVPGQFTSSSSQSPSIAVSVPISSSSPSGSQSEQGTINGISSFSSSTDNQLNPLEITVDRSTSPFIVDLTGPAQSGITSNIAANPSSSVSISTVDTTGRSVAAPNVIDLPGQVLVSSTSPLPDSSASVSTSSSSAGGQSGPVAIIIDSNTSPDLPGQEIIGKTAPSIKSPVSVSATTPSTEGQAEQVVLNRITTTSSSKEDQSGTVPITLGSNTSPSVGDLPGQVIIDATLSSAGSPILVNAVSTSTSSSGGQAGAVAINGITTTSSKEGQPGADSITLDSNISPSTGYLPGQDIINTISSSTDSPISFSGEKLGPVTINGVTTTSSSKDQSGAVSVTVGSNSVTSIGDLPGHIGINTSSSSVSSPESVNVINTSSASTAGKSVTVDGITTDSSQTGSVSFTLRSPTSPIVEDFPRNVAVTSISPSTEGSVSINGITTTSSSKDQSGAVSVIVGSNSGTSTGDLPGHIGINTSSSSVSNPESVNVINTSSASTAGKSVTVDGITTDSSQTGSVSFTLRSPTSPIVEDFPRNVAVTSTSPSTEGSVSIYGVTTTSSSKDQSGAVSVILGSNSATSTGDLPGYIGIKTSSSSVSSPESVNTINTSSASTSGQSVTVDRITTDSSQTGSVFTLGSPTSPIVEDFPRKVVVTSISPSKEGSVSINAVSSSSSSTGDQEVVINGGTITTSSKEERSGPVTVTVGSGGSPGQLTIESTSSSKGSPVSVSSIRTNSLVAGKKGKFPLRDRIKISLATSPTENLLGSLVKNTGKITINRVKTASTSTHEPENETISTDNNCKTVIEGQDAEITSTRSHPLPGFETELDSQDIVTTISNSSFTTSDETDKLSGSDDLQNQLHKNNQHIPKGILKRLDPGAHKKHRISQLVTAPKNSDKLFQLILKFNSTLDKYMKQNGKETTGINTKDKLLMELPWDKENLGPAAFIDKYLNEEWHSNITNEIEESGKIRADSRYRKHNSHFNHPQKKGFIIDENELIPLEQTTILPGSSGDNHFDWTGTVHANSCHGDCNAEPACGYTCGRTCIDYKERSRYCNRNEECNVGACQCKPGFVLDLNTNRCVHPKQCTQCGLNEYLDECPDLCIPEECPSEQPQTDCRSNDYCPKPVCRCIINHRRNKNDVCVPIQQCPKLKCYGPNEVYTPCTREDHDENCASGLPQCFTSKIRNQSPIICIPQCTCTPGHLRNSYNECVPVNQCSSTSHWKQEIVDETTEEEVIEI